MKKITLFTLLLVMALSLSIPALAAVGGFISSPSNNQAPEVVDATAENAPEVVTVEVIVTAYADRAQLSEEEKALLEAAYSDIKGTSDVTTLTEALAKLADEKKIARTDLAVSDLFDLHANVADAGQIAVKLRSNYTENFVALLHDNNGSWEVVENAAIDGEYLTFTADSFSPFAIVVDTAEHNEPENDYTVLYALAGIAVVAAVAVGAICVVNVQKNKVK